MSGIVGRFMSSFGFTAAFAIMVSLVVSFTLTPMLCSRFLKLSPGHDANATKQTLIFKLVDVPYQAMLRWSMRHRWVIVVVSIATVLSTGFLFRFLGVDFLPQDDQSEFEVTVRMPAGSSLEGTDGIMREVEADLRKLPGVKNLLTQIGSDPRQQVDRGTILVALVQPVDRKESQFQVMDMARETLKKYKDLIVAVQLPAVIQGAGPNRDFQYFLQGPDLAQLDVYAKKLVAKLGATPGVADLESSYEAGKPEVRVLVNRNKAADLNVNVASIATALRTLVAGDEQVTTYREGDDRYDVGLRVTKEFRNSPDAMSRLYVPSSTLGNVALSSVASLSEDTGPIGIDRRNRQRQILISASVVGGQSLSEVLAVADNTVKELNMPPGYRSGTIGRSKELGRAGASFVIAFLLSIIFMYMILAAQFESFVDPIVILLSLPLSMPFALLSLIIMRENFSIIYSSVGILVLFGIVKKNSILQVDHIKALRREGMPRLEAILKGCEDRLRPILMTTAALVAGMLPLALGQGAGAGTRRTVAIVVIGGQTLCLLLTLLVTPVSYSLFDDFANAHWFRRLGNLFRWRRAAGPTAALLALAAILVPMAQGADELNKQRVGVGVTTRKLTLKEAVEAALQNNLEIEIERTNIANAQQLLNAAKGVFDPILSYNPSYERRDTPAASVLQAATGKLEERFVNNNVGVRSRAPWQGMSLGVSFDNTRTETNNPFVNLNPYLNSRLLFTYTQPLFRNRVIDRERAQIKIRSKQVGLSETEFELRVIDVIARVEQAYWDLVAARQAVQVAEDGVKLGQEQLARTERQIAAGSLAPVEISLARSEFERRRDSYYAAQDILTAAENNLKLLVANGRANAVWSDEVVPTDSETIAKPESEELGSAVQAAIAKRPEIRLLGQRKSVNDLERDLNRDQLKPQVNFVAGYANSGLAGALSSAPNPFEGLNTGIYTRLNQLSGLAGLSPVLPPVQGALPPFLIGGYGSTLANVFTGRFPTVQVGMQFELNLRNRTAEAALAQTAIAEKRLGLERTRLEQAIDAQVRNALQGLVASRQRIAAAEASAKAAQEKLNSEVRLFQTGESTNFFVLQRQNELLESRRRAVVAHLEYNKSAARLEQARGETLETMEIKLK
jgi:HAE1 family hydrophobic/amphiphilic exporter-1